MMSGQEGSAIIHSLPDNPETTIIHLDFQGGQLRRLIPDPILSITSDGTVFLRSVYEKSTLIKAHISLDEIQDILRFAIDENCFFEFDPAKVKKDVEAATKRKGKKGSILDSATTSIRIQTADKDYTINYYALSFTAKQFPEIKELQQLLAIQKRLQQLISIIRANE
jgi:hypothetical protein